MIQDSTTDKTKLPNQGIVGIGKVAVAGATAAFVSDEMVQDVCVGVMVSGFKDIVISNAAEAAQSIGLHGIDYGQNGNWSPDNHYYPEYNGNGAGGGYNANGAGYNAAGNTAKVAY